MRPGPLPPITKLPPRFKRGLFVVVALLVSLVTTVPGGTVSAQQTDDSDGIWLVTIPNNDAGWAILNGTGQWVSPECRTTIENYGGSFAIVEWPVIGNTASPTRELDCTEIQNLYFEEPPGAVAEPDTEPATGSITSPTRTPQENLDLILSNPIRNTSFDNLDYAGVPMNQIPWQNLLQSGDRYNEQRLYDPNNTSAYFRVKCEVTHFGYDDPIAFPNQPGRAHLHMFFGNTETNAYSTYDSLLNSGSGSCNGENLNRTAYWVPALLDPDGNALIPFEVMVYYKNDNFRINGQNELAQPFPPNLRIIAGRGGADSPQYDNAGGWPVVSWSCGPAYNAGPEQPVIPNCDPNGEGQYGQALEMKIRFPHCHNGNTNQYFPESNILAYPDDGFFGAACPNSHPDDMSTITYRIFFSPNDYPEVDFSQLVLSSDVRHNGTILPGGTTLHADWFGAWNEPVMDLWIDNCNNIGGVDCETGLVDATPGNEISLRPRREGFYQPGYLAPAEQLSELCPSKQFNSNDPVRSVASCRHQ